MGASVLAVFAGRALDVSLPTAWTVVGILVAIHVAYRLMTGRWMDAQ